MRRARPQTAALLASPDDVEAQFYEALQQADLDRLMAVWSDDDDIACVHPGGPRLLGHASIRASFEAIFANGGVAVRPQGVKRVLGLSCAVHHVSEHITITSNEGGRTAWAQATNVYLKTALGWRLVAHHASPGSKPVEAMPGEAPSTLH